MRIQPILAGLLVLAVLVLVAGPPRPAAAEPQPPAWEYAQYGSFSSDVKTARSSWWQTPAERTDAGTLKSLLAKLGAKLWRGESGPASEYDLVAHAGGDGWELAFKDRSDYSVGNVKSKLVVFWFKRPRR